MRGHVGHKESHLLISKINHHKPIDLHCDCVCCVWQWKKLNMSSVERRRVLCSVTFHVVAITCVIWSLYVLIHRTTQEIQEGEWVHVLWHHNRVNMACYHLSYYRIRYGLFKFCDTYYVAWWYEVTPPWLKCVIVWLHANYETCKSYYEQVARCTSCTKVIHTTKAGIYGNMNLG